MPLLAALPTDAKDLKELLDKLARYDRDNRYLLNGRVDSQNIFEAGGWRVLPDQLVSKDSDVGMSTADTAGDDVRFFAGPNGAVWFFYVTKSGKLYATDAFITGRIEGSVIVGSEIKTAESTYPRVELSSSGNIFAAYKSATDYIAIDPDATGNATLIFENGLTTVLVSAIGSTYAILGLLGNISINAQSGDLSLSAGGDIFLTPSTGKVKLADWTKIISISTNQTIQDVINALESQLDQKQNNFVGGDIVVIDDEAFLTATGIGAGTYTKLTINTQGRATAGTTLSSGDIPTLSQSKITNLTTDLSDLQTQLNAITNRTAVSAHASVTQSISVSTWTKVIFGAEENDALNEFNPTTSLFTAQETGSYLVTIHANWVLLAANTRTLVKMVFNGGTSEIWVDDRLTGNASSQSGVGGSSQISLTASDTIEIHVFTTNAATLQIPYTRLSICRVA